MQNASTTPFPESKAGVVPKPTVPADWYSTTGRGHGRPQAQPAVPGANAGTLSESASNRRWRWWAALAIFLGALILYGATAGPSIVELFDDSLEFQLIGPTLGIAHPTGYPLYTLGGFLWSRLLFPVGNWAWRMNLYSALFGALTVALLFHLTTRLVTRTGGGPNWWAGLAAAAFFGLGPTWWGQATIAEVYALHNFLLIALMSVAIGINRTVSDARPDAPPAGTAFQRRMTLIALLVGLGLAHHRTIVLALPGLALYLLWSVPGIWRPQRAWLLWLVALLTPLLLYAILPLRASMGVRDLNGAYVNTVTGFFDHVLARSYTSFFRENALAVARSAGDWLTLVRNEIGLVGLALALVGLPWLFDGRRRPAKAWFFILVVGATNLLFALNYRVGDVEVFLLPVFLCLALFAGAGVGTVERLLTPYSDLAGNILQGTMVVLLAFGVGGRGPSVNRSDDWPAHDYAVAMAKVPFPPGSHVIGLEGEMTALQYMQRAENLAPGVTPVVADDPDKRRALLASLVEAGNPVYLTRELAGIEERYSFGADGPLVHVWPRGEAEPSEPTHWLDERMGDGLLRLVGYDAAILEEAGGPALALALYWQPDGQIDGNYKLSLRVLDEMGEPLADGAGNALVADRFPLRQVAPTWSWLPAEMVRDVQTIDLPTDWRDRASRLQVIVYDAESIAEIGRWELNLATLRP